MNRFFQTITLFIFAFTLKGQTQMPSNIQVNPNPFVKRTQATYTLLTTDTISVLIINLIGQTIDSVSVDQVKTSGVYQDSIKMDTKPDGAYFLVIKNKTKTIVGIKIIKSMSTGIHQVFNSSSVKIYPNPSSNKLRLEFSDFNTDQINLELINLLGKTIYSLDNVEQNQEIDLSEFACGIYFLKLYNNSEQKIFKIIKE